MKKVAFMLIGLLAMMLAGCGEGSSKVNIDGVDDGPTEVVTTVEPSVSEETTPQTPYNLSSNLGTPPGLPIN